MTKGIVFPKIIPYFILHEKDIMKRYGSMRLGKIKMPDTKKVYYFMEDKYSATRYNDYASALRDFNENVKIEKELKKELRRR